MPSAGLQSQIIKVAVVLLGEDLFSVSPNKVTASQFDI